MEKMSGGALTKKGVTFTDTTALSSTTWRVGIASKTDASRNTLILPILSFENTSDDLETITTQLGKKMVTSKPIPSGTIMLDASLCDYKQLHDLEDTWFEFVPFFQGGSYWLTRKSDGTLKGFRCKIATKAGLPPEDKTMSYPIYLMFDSYNEFEDVVVVSPTWGFSDIQDYSPVGLDIRIVTAYTAGDVVVKITKRGSGAGLTGLTVAGSDFSILDSNAAPLVAVTAATDDGQGVYTLTIKSDSGGTPANLAAGEFAVLQAHDDDATYLTYLSHALTITA
jgi:hypothetical protein